MAAAHLRVVQVDEETGELVGDGCPSCQALQHELDELIRKFKGQSRELGEIRRDKDAEARAHEAWPTAVKLFEYWKSLTGHKRARWTEDRFWLILPHLRKLGSANCAAAIAGIAYQHYAQPRKNGTTEHFDGFETCFKDTGRVEAYVKRRPKDWVLPPEFEQ